MLHGRAKIETATAKIKEHELTLDMFAAVNAVALISILLYWNALSTFPSLPLFPLSHFLLEGKKHKIRFLQPVCVCVCVSIENERKGNNRQWELQTEGKSDFGPEQKSMIYINLAHHSQSWRQFESDHHSLLRSAGVFQAGNGFRKFTLLSGFSFIPRWQWMDYDVEWVLQSVATCTAKGKKIAQQIH